LACYFYRMTLLGIQIFGWEIDTSLFIFGISLIGGFSWWLIAIYYDVHEMKKASVKRGKQLDLLIIKHEALAETLGMDGMHFGKTFRREYDKNVEKKIEEYKVEIS
jgi:hypothetical protein